ncbi:MAG: DUF5723 family protein [Cyclobacteriaceae bacterium]|nr:DUF5723 family protein [Cyclobacteriaceae bacterium]
MNYKNIRYISLIWIGLLAVNTLYAQQEFTLYHMPVLSQATYLNPAAVPEHKVSLSLPIPSVFVGFNNSALNVKAFVDKNGNVDYNKFVDGLDKNNNYLGVGANSELFHLRVKAANNFFSAHTRVVNDFRFIYPKDLLGIGSVGIKDGYSLSGLGINFNSYLEYGLGFTRVKPDSKWTYGARVKMLKGIANIQTKSSEIELAVNQNDIYQYDLNTKMEVNIAAGVDPLQVSSVNDISNINFNSYNDAKNVLKLNTGYAVDLGATLQFSEKLSFGIAVNNLGYINWNSYVENYSADVNLKFDGVILENIDFTGNIDSLFNTQVDSIFQSYEDTFNSGTDTTQIGYKTWLPTNVFLSAHYQFSPSTRATASLYTEFFDGVSLGAVVGINHSIGRGFDFTTSWWWFKNSGANLGLGIVFKPAFAQFYVVMDNVLPASFIKVSDPETNLSGVYLPYEVKNFNIRVGMNFVFGRIKNESRLPNLGISKHDHGVRRYLYKPSLK